MDCYNELRFKNVMLIQFIPRCQKLDNVSIFVVLFHRTITDMLVNNHPHTQDTHIPKLVLIVKSAVTLLSIFHCVILLHEREETDDNR